MVSTSQLSVIVYIYVKNYSSPGIFTRFNVKSRWSKNICDIVLYSEWVGNVWKSPQAVKHRSFDQLVVGYGCYYVKKFNPLGFGFGSGSGSGLLILGDPVAVSRAGRKDTTKVFRLRRKSSWVPTLTGPLPNGQANAGS